MARGKRYANASEKIEQEQTYDLAEAIGLLKESATAKFDESVDIAIRLGVDPRQPDQALRGTVDLPHGTGKTARVIAFAEGEQAREAEEAGAVAVGADDLVERVAGGWLEFDTAVATPQMMPRISRPLGRVLGPRGLMPNPRTGTIGTDLGALVRAIQGGRIDYRVDRTSIVHAPVGRASFSVEQLDENIRTIVDTLVRLRPASAKGAYLRSIALSPTMGPGVRVDTSTFAVRTTSD
jgi:large subunit ribosomal protein L1